ncbi:MAG: hypothetical protein HC890_02990 [Chloroflexaceae bacterium]|nr:hypothetical protein [Chloroflexaceae bacterium]
MPQIVIDVPDRLAEQLEPFQAQLPWMLELGLRELQLQQQSAHFLDEQEIITLLASQPTPEQILAIRPSPELQARVSELLAHSKAENLSSKEEAKLERYPTLEHLVRLAKSHGLAQLPQQ